MTAEPDAFRHAAIRERIQKIHRVRDLLRANSALILLILAAAIIGSLIVYPSPLHFYALILFLPFAKIGMMFLSVLPFFRFTLGGLFFTIVAPQVAFVLLTSGDGTLELVGCVVLTSWITALVYFMGKINAAMQRYEYEQKRTEHQMLSERLRIPKFENQSE